MKDIIYIPISLLKYKDSFPNRFKPKGVPTVLFIEPKEQKVFYRSFGYKRNASIK